MFLANYLLRASNKMNRIMGILPMKLGQDGHATKEKLILLEALSFPGQSKRAASAYIIQKSYRHHIDQQTRTAITD